MELGWSSRNGMSVNQAHELNALRVEWNSESAPRLEWNSEHDLNGILNLLHDFEWNSESASGI
jgi:hypothetical protein